MSNELREKVKELMAEYPITDILNALWSNVDEIRMELVEDNSTYHDVEKRNELRNAEKQSSMLYSTWESMRHSVL